MYTCRWLSRAETCSIEVYMTIVVVFWRYRNNKIHIRLISFSIIRLANFKRFPDRKCVRISFIPNWAKINFFRVIIVIPFANLHASRFSSVCLFVFLWLPSLLLQPLILMNNGPQRSAINVHLCIEEVFYKEGNTCKDIGGFFSTKTNVL
jgi:hypothetical protein